MKIKNSKIFFLDINKLNSSNIRLVNFKLIWNGLPTNVKFKNVYDSKCFMCKRKLNEDLEHIFVRCKYSIDFYEYIRENFMQKKSLTNSLDLLKFKRGIAENDKRALACFVYGVWRVRNICRIDEKYGNLMSNFKAIFNKWFITLSNI